MRNNFLKYFMLFFIISSLNFSLIYAETNENNFNSNQENSYLNSISIFFNNFNFRDFFSIFIFWNEPEKKKNDTNKIKNNISNKKENLRKTKTDSKKLSNNNLDKKDSVKIIFGKIAFDSNNLKSSLNSKNNVRNYIKEFGYKCIGINTDHSKKYTFNFDLNSGKITSIKKGINCDTEIYVEGSLIEDLYYNGFSSKKIKSYLSKVNLPTMMYVKAIKVLI